MKTKLKEKKYSHKLQLAKFLRLPKLPRLAHLPYLSRFTAFLACVVAFAIFVTSCASNQRFENGADFCGIVVNHKNIPISGYRVTISYGAKKVSAFTDKSGLFVFHDVPSGTVAVSGEGAGFGTFSVKKLFSNRSDITYIQVCDVATIFEQIEKEIAAENFSSAFSLLEEISPSESNAQQFLIHYIKFLLCKKQNDFKSAKKEIDVARKIDLSDKKNLAEIQRLRCKVDLSR